MAADGHWVFAYGSEMHLGALRHWLAEHRFPVDGILPDSAPATLPGWTLAWDFYRKECGGGTANARRAEGERLHGLALHVDAATLAAIDRKADLNVVYQRHEQRVELAGGGRRTAWVYTVVAHRRHPEATVWPHPDERQRLIAGAREAGLPADWIARLEATPTAEYDEDGRQRAVHDPPRAGAATQPAPAQLLAGLRGYDANRWDRAEDGTDAAAARLQAWCREHLASAFPDRGSALLAAVERRAWFSFVPSPASGSPPCLLCGRGAFDGRRAVFVAEPASRSFSATWSVLEDMGDVSTQDWLFCEPCVLHGWAVISNQDAGEDDSPDAMLKDVLRALRNDGSAEAEFLVTVAERMFAEPLPYRTHGACRICLADPAETVRGRHGAVCEDCIDRLTLLPRHAGST